jgi:hypothetical protein
MEEADMSTRTRGTSEAREATPSQARLRPIRIRTTLQRTNATAASDAARIVFGRTEPTKKEIRERAYYIYLARGGVNGDPVSDWLQAERELRAELRGAASFGWHF